MSGTLPGQYHLEWYNVGTGIVLALVFVVVLVFVLVLVALMFVLVKPT